MKFKPIVVTTTSDDQNLLESMARQLIDGRLAACVQISGPITSCYRWQDVVETSQEWVCTIKTSHAKFEQLQSKILELHNYDQPQLIAVDVVVASPRYLNWMQAELEESE